MALDIGTPVRKNVGEKDVIPVRLTDWLDGESVSTVTATIEAGVDSITVGTAIVSTTELTIVDKATAIGDAVLVPYTVANGDVDMARILLEVQSSNANRKLKDRAIPIRIVG